MKIAVTYEKIMYESSNFFIICQFPFFPYYHSYIHAYRQAENIRKIAAVASAAAAFALLSTEGHTVGALVHSGICLMGAYQDAVQRAVICLVAVMRTLLDSALDALVCITVHSWFLLFT